MVLVASGLEASRGLSHTSYTPAVCPWSCGQQQDDEALFLNLAYASVFSCSAAFLESAVRPREILYMLCLLSGSWETDSVS